MALRGFANTARYMVESDGAGYVWNQQRDGKPTTDNLRCVVMNVLMFAREHHRPQKWARIVDQRDGSEVCRIEIDATCMPSEWARNYRAKFCRR